MPVVAVYTEQRVYPAVSEVLQDVFVKYPDVTDVVRYDETTDIATLVLVLGVMPERVPARYVKTISQKQVLARPSALTELHTAVINLLQPPTFAPMQYKVVSVLTPAQERALGNTLVFDIETGRDMRIAVLPHEKSLLCVGINDGTNIYVYREQSLRKGTAGYEQLRRVLTDPKRKLIAHNMKFDAPIVSAHLNIKITGHADTMLLHHAISIGAKEHGLKPLAQKYLGAEEWEGDLKQYTRASHDYASIPREILYKYNAYDVYWTWFLWKYLERIAVQDARVAKVAKFEFQMSRLFQAVEANGIAVDLPYLAELDKMYEAKDQEALVELRTLAGDDKFNPGSPMQVKQVFADCGVPLPKTDEKTLQALNLDGEIAKLRDRLLDIRGYRKMRGTYVQGMLTRRRDNLVFPSYLIHGTATGRLSSKDPGIQTIPRDKVLRSIFVPRAPGRQLIQVDYSQAELRVMACLSGDPYLQSLFQRDSPDFFDALMPVAYPTIDLESLDSGTRKQLRARLKGIIYGLSYGRQARAISQALTEDAPEAPTSVDQAQTIIDNYFQQAPKLFEWRQEVIATVLDPDRSLISPFGRQYQAEVITSGNKQGISNSGLAFLPQGTASDICVSAAMRVQVNLESGEYGDTMIVALVHDAILLDAANEHVDQAGSMVQYEMEESGRRVFGDQVVFAAEPGHGKNWAEA